MNKIISILGAKGGSGQSVISANLAISISKKIQQQVALLELNLNSSGSIASLFNLTVDKPISEILHVIDYLTPELLKGYLKTHPSGVSILSGTNSSGQEMSFPHNHLAKIVSLLNQIYPYIIIDTERTFSDFMLAIFDQCHLILLVLTPEITSFQEAKYCLDKFSSLHYPLGIVKFVLNMADIKGGLPVDKIPTLLLQNILLQIPYEQEIISSINQGVPVVTSLPRSKFTKAISELAEKIVTQDDLFLFEKRPPRVEHEKVSTAKIIPQEQKVDLTDQIRNLKEKVHKELLQQLDLKTIDMKTSKEAIKETLEKILSTEDTSIISRDQRAQLINEMLDEVLGLGPLEPFLRDPTISEIMTSGTDKIYIEQAGKIRLTGAKFASQKQLMTVIERIVSPIGRRVDESSPLCDARLKDGSRVNIVIPPLSLDGPAITIRKFMEKKLSIEDLIGLGSITKQMGEFLRLCVLARKNIIVSGGTGSGKTTLLNILSSFIPSNERIVTIEDSAELKLQQEHVIRLESRPPNIEGGGEISIRRLVINALRMRPDRIVVGECRGGEALDMLQAMNTGHDGSITTVHANSPRDALTRIETMVLMAGVELPVKAIREQIKSAIDIIVQQARLSDGTRKIISITEVTGMEGDIITTQDIFRFEQTGIDPAGKVLGKFTPTGIIPTFIDEIKSKGLELDLSIFQK